MFFRSRQNSPSVAEDDSAESTAVARRLAIADAHVIGFLPATERAAIVLSPFLKEWAARMTNFVTGEIGIIESWGSWNGQAGGDVRAHPDRPGVISLVPPACSDAATAIPALEDTVSRHREGCSRILVDLGRYAPPGQLPGTVDIVDGVVFAVLAGRTRRSRLVRLLEHLDARKKLGAILIEGIFSPGRSSSRT